MYGLIEFRTSSKGGTSWTRMVYMSSTFWLSAPESRDLYQAGKEMIVYQAEQIHKMILWFTQNGPRLSF